MFKNATEYFKASYTSNPIISLISHWSHGIMRTTQNCLICVSLNHFKTSHFFLIARDSLKYFKIDWPNPWISPAWEANSRSVCQKFPVSYHNMNVPNMFTKAHTGHCSKENQSSHICPSSFLNILLNTTAAATSDLTCKIDLCSSTQCSDQCYSNLSPVRARALQFNVLQVISDFYTIYL